ncbi:hypothetical protein [Streptomyces sp. NBC_00005]|uniref:hypothetical protein n=1 Tax=Streptomyces sp. NBC_00005 TaxID=2903609 RepID=UPI003255CEF8
MSDAFLWRHMAVPDGGSREPVRELVRRQICIVELRRAGQVEGGRQDATYA